jgi:hypothetical protein
LHSGDLHQYHTRIDEYLEKILGDMSRALIQKLVSVLDSVLKKLSRYDEGSFFAQILSLAVKRIFFNFRFFIDLFILYRNQSMKMDKHMYHVLMLI